MNDGATALATSGPQTLEQELIAVYQQYAPGLLRYAASLTRNPDEAHDAVQETFLRFFVERKYGRTIESPRAWLYQVLRNHLLDLIKTAATAREVSSEDLDRHPAPGISAEAMIQGEELAQQIAAKLSDREFSCLRLRTEGLGYAEIAETMGVRCGTVGALLARVHRKLGRQTSSSLPLGTAEAVRLLMAEP